jgi:hypothetical protein
VLEARLIEFRHQRDKAYIAAYFTAHPGEVVALVDIVKTLRPYPYKEYASWFLSHLVKAHPQDFQRYYADFVDVLFRTEDQTVLRNVMVCLVHLEFETYRASEFIDHVLSFVKNPSHKVALQVYSIYVLISAAKLFPELVEEFRQTIDFHAQNKSAAYHVAQRNFHRAYSKK